MSSHPTRLAALAAEANEQLEGAPPRITSSMSDAVLAHLASGVRPGIDVVFLDTGYHFVPTIETRDHIAAMLPIHVIDARPEQSVAEQNLSHGMSLYARDPDLCCALRKVAPLDKALEPYVAWAAGVRRDESPARRLTPVVGWDSRRDKVKVNPLAGWTVGDVEAYIAEHDLPVHPLLAQGFPSIGCAPCTRWVPPGEDTRSGRWAGREKTECGIHL